MQLSLRSQGACKRFTSSLWLPELLQSTTAVLAHDIYHKQRTTSRIFFSPEEMK
jgi:hypothetical protein